MRWKLKRRQSLRNETNPEPDNEFGDPMKRAELVSLLNENPDIDVCDQFGNEVAEVKLMDANGLRWIAIHFFNEERD